MKVLGAKSGERREGAMGPTATRGEVVAFPRRYPVGAELSSDGVHFRVWAPAAESAAVELLDQKNAVQTVFDLTAEPGGYFGGFLPEAKANDRYRYRLPAGSFPDPASRFQPDGPHGASVVIDPTYAWTDAAWRGRPTRELVLYELHLGTFTRQGTWQAAMEQLPELARIGVTAIEVMPIADFPGRFGWGYDGVNLFAPCRLYGSPLDAKQFVDRAHALGLMVILDVVYNHLGPDGCYLRDFSADYFSRRYTCEWGDPLNFDGANSAPVREFYLTNARYWIEEFHFDGLRLDATQQIFDRSPTHIIAEVASAARAAAPQRRLFIVGENEAQETKLTRSRSTGGFEIDALWNDDFHHSAVVAVTGRAEAYYSDYRGSPQEFISAYKYGYLFQGQLYSWQKRRRGTPSLDLSPQHFVDFLENHDQVANSLHGRRLHQLASPAIYRAMTAVLLLTPGLPMLFQGQEFAASSPFLYFADHNPELAPKVAAGRRNFLRQFRSIDTSETSGVMAQPSARETFLRCQLDFTERERHAASYRLHGDLLRLRRDDSTLATPDRIDGAVLSDRAFVIRYFNAKDGDRLLIVNLGATLMLSPAPEPLLAPLADRGWAILWSSESPNYNGSGTPELETVHNWILPAQAAVVLAPHDQRELHAAKISEKD